MLGRDVAEQTAGRRGGQAALDGLRNLGELGRASPSTAWSSGTAPNRSSPRCAGCWPRGAFVDLQTVTVGAVSPEPSDAWTTSTARWPWSPAPPWDRRRDGRRLRKRPRWSSSTAPTTWARRPRWPRLGGLPLGLDITDPDAPQRLGDFLEAQTGGVDIVVHNAGVTRDKTLGRMDAARWNLAVDVNLGAVLRHTAHLDASGALRDGGRVILLSSIAGLAGNAGQTNYAASKAGLVGALPGRARPRRAGHHPATRPASSRPA